MTKNVSLTRAERKARWLELKAEEFDLLCPPDGAEAVYATKPEELYPPGCRSRRQARDRIRRVPEHAVHGAGPSTVYSVAAEAYHGFYSKRPLAKAPAPPTPVLASDEELAETALDDAGLRSTRRSA